MKKRIVLIATVLFFAGTALFAAPFTLDPSIHLTAAAGDSEAEEGALALGHHDPTRESGTVQGIEAGLSLRTEYHLEGFATYTFYYGLEEEWEDELEEGFLKLVDLPGGFEVRGGRMLSRFGGHNTRHLHGWDRVDMPLVLGRFLGDDGLILDGADVLWSKSGIASTYGLLVGFGEAKTHEHGDDEHDHDHEHDADHAHEEHEEDGHDDHAGHAHDMGRFVDRVFNGRAFARWNPDDFVHHQAGISAAFGENGFGRDTAVVGLDYSRTWRENGIEAGGRQLVWETEVLARHVEAVEPEHHEEHEHDAEDEHDEHDEDHEHHAEHEHEENGGDLDKVEYGFETSMTATLHDMVDFGVHAGWVSGIDELDVDERWRFSPVVTFRPMKSETVSFRVQYNYDMLEDEDVSSVWAQLNISFGGPEVR